MTLVATYNQPDARVELTTTGLVTAGVAIFTVQRSASPSGPWANVRGLVAKSATTNSAQTWYDYEFDAGPGVTNYYQVVGQPPAQVVGFGTPSTSGPANPTSLSASWHASTAAGDLLIATLVGTGPMTSPNTTPSGDGWIPLAVIPNTLDAVNASMLSWMKVVKSGDAGPTTMSIPYDTGNGYAQLQIVTLRNVNPVVLGYNSRTGAQQPSSTTQIGFPGLLSVPTEDHSLIFVSATSAGTTGWTSVAASTGFTMIDEPGFSRSNLVQQYRVQTTAAAVGPDVMTITGGSHAQTLKIGVTMAIQYNSSVPVSLVFSDDVDTPLTEVWLKDPLRPPRNRVVQVASPTQIQRTARSGLFDIKGRADPIEVGEIRREIAWTQRWVFTTFDELDDLIELFSSGRTLLLQVPARGDVPDCPPWPRNLPGGFISIGTISQENAPDEPIPGTMTAPVQVVARPDPGQGYLEAPAP